MKAIEQLEVLNLLKENERLTQLQIESQEIIDKLKFENEQLKRYKRRCHRLIKIIEAMNERRSVLIVRPASAFTKAKPEIISPLKKDWIKKCFY